MSVYLVDFENVKNKGLRGATLLTPKDVLFIFYSKYALKLDGAVREEIENSGAAVDFLMIRKTAKNYLDFQLSTFLGFLAERFKSQDDFYIISNDKGYDAVVDFWNDNAVIGRKIFLHRRDCIASSFVQNVSFLSETASMMSADRIRKSANIVERKALKEKSGNWKGELHNRVSPMKLTKAERKTLDECFASSSNAKEYMNGLRDRFGKNRGNGINSLTKAVFVRYCG